ncbi:MerR family transcriptional regulator [Govanella unica]|uniref:MerR family DNA-binding transcriptional regulator n=1 Tax=Govanella unica TaxID=2975056 RepID=A0A9X3TVE7_9PROT|nr:MerR family DNA-binding transcriptional regulator [Govania unica]MDA5192476.1 MerR family DNA-binding transcriptional regulator [Govania unica]
MSDKTYSISDLAQEFSVTPRAIRFYEDRDLINPERVGQNRIYSTRDHTRLAWILRGKRVGLSLAEIGELLDMYDLGDNRLTQRRATLVKLRERIGILERQREDIEATLREVQDFCATIEDLLTREDPAPAEAKGQR